MKSLCRNSPLKSKTIQPVECRVQRANVSSVQCEDVEPETEECYC
jgi:hypothetical protein